MENRFDVTIQLQVSFGQRNVKIKDQRSKLRKIIYIINILQQF